MRDMAHKPFRALDEWKSALMTLPENSFFELLRSVLGNIKTPFSKQRLMDDLVNLLSREEIRKTIAAYINEQDHKIIAAVAILNEPAPSDLDAFFAGEFTHAELHANIINLEERLIIYRVKETLCLALNPVLEEILNPLIMDTQALFPSYEDKDEIHSDFVYEDRIIAALFAFIQDEAEIVKPENGTDAAGTPFHGALPRGIRKKVLDAAKRIFPALDIEQVIKIFLTLGLLKLEGRSLISDGGKVKGYCELTPVERQEYWTAALYLCRKEANAGLTSGDMYAALETPLGGARYFFNKLRLTASFIHRFRSFMDPDRKYPETTLRRLWELLGKNNYETENVWATQFYDNKPQFPFEPLFAAMETTGLLVKKETCWKAPCFVVSGSVPVEAKPVIVMDAALSFVLYPEIPFADAMALGSFCSVKENDKNTIHFELNRQSVVRGFDQGLKADTMINLLDRLSLNRLDVSLAWTLREWESRYSGVSLHQGIILTLEEDRRYLADAGPVSRLIQKTLAPGVYLLSSEEKSEAVKTLLKAGVDIVAQPPIEFETGRDILSRSAFNPLSLSGSADLPFCLNMEPPFKEEKKSDETADSIKQKFRKTLEKMKLGKQEQDELLARIDRRLVLSDAQLEGASLRYEKLEARGLDYSGKAAIAKQAVETGSLLEISWPGQDGETNRTTGTAQALEKKDGDSILVLRAEGNSENGARDFRIPLRKISLLRRIKQSIFGE